MPFFYPTLVIVRLLVVALGAIIIYLTFKSHRQNHSNGMLFLSIGFALITVGAVVEGVLFEFLALDIFWALTVESIMTASGFTAIIYSIYRAKT